MTKETVLATFTLPFIFELLCTFLFLDGFEGISISRAIIITYKGLDTLICLAS